MSVKNTAAKPVFWILQLHAEIYRRSSRKKDIPEKEIRRDCSNVHSSRYLLSDVKVTLMELPSEVMSDGNLEPQKTPCFLKISSPSLLLTSTESYSHSC